MKGVVFSVLSEHRVLYINDLYGLVYTYMKTNQLEEDGREILWIDFSTINMT